MKYILLFSLALVGCNSLEKLTDQELVKHFYDSKECKEIAEAVDPAMMQSLVRFGCAIKSVNDYCLDNPSEMKRPVCKEATEAVKKALDKEKESKT